jgi:hypothetical protein
MRTSLLLWLVEDHATALAGLIAGLRVYEHQPRQKGAHKQLIFSQAVNYLKEIISIGCVKIFFNIAIARPNSHCFYFLCL